MNHCDHCFSNQTEQISILALYMSSLLKPASHFPNISKNSSVVKVRLFFELNILKKTYSALFKQRHRSKDSTITAAKPAKAALIQTADGWEQILENVAFQSKIHQIALKSKCCLNQGLTQTSTPCPPPPSSLSSILVNPSRPEPGRDEGQDFIHS